VPATPGPSGSSARAIVAREVDHLLERLQAVSAPSALNLYDERAGVAAGDRPGDATRRLDALRAYLLDHWSAPVVLVGEAPGRHGARLTGVPFTSPRLLHGSGPAEASATVVHRTMAELGAGRRVLLWNASVLFRRDNLIPLADALAASREVLGLATAGRTVYAVGRVAATATGAPYLRHPSHGGSRAFAAGLADALGRRVPGAVTSAGVPPRRSPGHRRPGARHPRR